ncbi:ArsS family sensor histidine kinase [Campylobacter gracilis]|uniref:histidine kinase n=1 Tax=Campylobacter gracilis RM3268 TaxID=553220 RepID=C8PJG2_9BACT|nr:ArsS family sensor histidine kinase [Campylobacter gracilis]AKT92284.1 two-component system sensor histidine kinase [Campylobacter gracilis]EEV17067.1 ATPase/histidine kinase/DNA gyrase B/HSP90 domain protein [Campylobacter gracilis RM3268]UEB45528.1 ArsS family sensor histidine kinase [Campylobacter gracilis]SUW81805.1 two-component sensor [Campylobacter gracilis]
MRNISIIKLISFFFFAALITVNLAFFIESKRQVRDAEYLTYERFMLGMRIRGQVEGNAAKQLAQIGLKNSELDPIKIRQGGEKIFSDSYTDMIRYNKKFYFVPRFSSIDPKMFSRIMDAAGLNISNKDDIAKNDVPLENLEEISSNGIWILWLVVNIVMVAFFIAVLKKLLRLRNLKNMIRRAGEEDKFRLIKVEANDEIGQIAGEFNTTMQKIDAIKQARALFLRNILHEFRNPIMKGRIMADMIAEILQDDKFKSRLKQIFIRLEIILGEVVKVEKLVSNEWELKKNKHRVIDIIDHSVDMLLIKDTSRIEVRADGEISAVKVDFELYATGVKNLIDNALKYSSGKVLVNIDKNAVCISSMGDELEPERLDFDRAFNRKIETSSSGLGLGLYIANQIFKKHGHTLKYKHEDGKNNFLICFINA